MIVFQIHLRAAEGAAAELERVISDEFVPAVRRQPGFIDVKVLRAYREQPGNPPELIAQGYGHQLVLTFVDESHRLAWSLSEDHEWIFPRVRALADGVFGAGYELARWDESSDLASG